MPFLIFQRCIRIWRLQNGLVRCTWMTWCITVPVHTSTTTSSVAWVIKRRLRQTTEPGSSLSYYSTRNSPPSPRQPRQLRLMSSSLLKTSTAALAQRSRWRLYNIYRATCSSTLTTTHVILLKRAFWVPKVPSSKSATCVVGKFGSTSTRSILYGVGVYFSA